MSARLTCHLDTVTRRRGDRGAPQVLVSAPGLDVTYGDAELPFHVASIGKLATAVLVMQLVDAGKITLGTPATDLLPPGTLDGLVTPDRIPTTTVGQLLAHEGGVADYFEGPVTSGPTFLSLVLDEPDRFWTPDDLLDFSRRFQTPVRPGFTYSDTGYVLLGRVLERSPAAPSTICCTNASSRRSRWTTRTSSTGPSREPGRDRSRRSRSARSRPPPSAA